MRPTDAAIHYNGRSYVVSVAGEQQEGEHEDLHAAWKAADTAGLHVVDVRISVGGLRKRDALLSGKAEA